MAGQFGRIKNDFSRAEAYAKQAAIREVHYVETLHWKKALVIFFIGFFLGFAANNFAHASGMTANANYNPANVTITGGTIGGITSFASQSPTVNDLGSPSAWSSSYNLFGPNANTTTQSALGLGYDNGNQVGYILSLTPGATWNGLTLDGSIINFYASGLPEASVSSTGFNSVNAYSLNGHILFSSTAPTIASGFNTSPYVQFNNGTAAFRVNTGSTGVTNQGIITLPSAPNLWNCTVSSDADPSTQYRTVITAQDSTSVSVQRINISTGVAVAWSPFQPLDFICVAM